MATHIAMCAQFNPELPLFMTIYKKTRIEIYFNGSAGDTMWRLMIDSAEYRYETLHECMARLEDMSVHLFHKRLKFFFPVEET